MLELELTSESGQVFSVSAHHNAVWIDSVDRSSSCSLHAHARFKRNADCPNGCWDIHVTSTTDGVQSEFTTSKEGGGAEAWWTFADLCKQKMGIVLPDELYPRSHWEDPLAHMGLMREVFGKEDTKRPCLRKTKVDDNA